jgi:hypothetical protein
MLEAIDILLQRYSNSAGRSGSDTYSRCALAQTPQVDANVFIDDRGFPDKTEYYENLLHNDN